MLHLRAARATDLQDVQALLRQAELPLEGVAEALEHFFVVEDAARIVAAGGVESYRPFGLLRSAVVDPEYRGLGIGARLVRHLLEDARARGLSAVFLLTTTAPEYFSRFGFRPVERVAVPTAVQQSGEFRDVCPISAAVMQINLEESRSLPQDAEELHRALSDLIRVYQFRDRDRICCYDVSVAQCHALDSLFRRGAIPLDELAAELFLDKSTTSRLVDSLERKGYVERRQHPDDRRALLLEPRRRVDTRRPGSSVTS